MTFSFGGCESDTSATDFGFVPGVAQQANAQGITWFAAAEDAGAAGCDQGSYPATIVLAVSFPASLPDIAAVGGTEFTDSAVDWSSPNASNYSSVVVPPPENAQVAFRRF